MGTRDKDLAVLRRLKEVGSDLNKPHTVDFFFVFSIRRTGQVGFK